MEGHATLKAVAAVMRHPALWGTALVQARRLAPRGWWRKRPFLPVPDRDYLRFRMQTQYGDPDHEPEPEDVITWLRWCRQFRTRDGLSPSTATNRREFAPEAPHRGSASPG